MQLVVGFGAVVRGGIPEADVERNVRRDAPVVLDVGDVIDLAEVTRRIEPARKRAAVLQGRGLEKQLEAVERVATMARYGRVDIRCHAREGAAEFHIVRALRPVHVVGNSGAPLAELPGTRCGGT